MLIRSITSRKTHSSNSWKKLELKKKHSSITLINDKICKFAYLYKYAFSLNKIEALQINKTVRNLN